MILQLKFEMSIMHKLQHSCSTRERIFLLLRILEHRKRRYRYFCVCEDSIWNVNCARARIFDLWMNFLVNVFETEIVSTRGELKNPQTQNVPIPADFPKY